MNNYTLFTSVTDNIRRGDMYYIINNGANMEDNRQGRPAIIVSNDINNKNSDRVEIVYLTSQEKRPMPTHVSIMCQVLSTAICENIYTVPKDRLSTKIRHLSCEEMQRIDQALICSLGLSQHNEVIPQKATAVSSENKSENTLKVELEIYKRLYDELLRKMMKGEPEL